MNNEIMLVDQREVLGKDFSIFGTFDEPLFLAVEVAEWIEHSDARRMIDTVDENEKLTGTILRSGQNRECWFLTEDGLYEVLMQSRKPIAKIFKSKVKEILKSIRKHGGYLTPSKIEEVLLNPDTLIQLATALKEERTKRAQLEAQREKDHPKVLFADSVCASSTSILIGDLAKILKQNGIDTGGTRLFEQLRKDGYLISRKGSSWNMPTQRSMDLGLMEVKESAHTNSDGSIVVTKTTKVTGKGQVYFINKYRNQPVLPLLEVC